MAVGISVLRKETLDNLREVFAIAYFHLLRADKVRNADRAALKADGNFALSCLIVDRPCFDNRVLVDITRKDADLVCALF